jgi:hypothetical protein
VEGEPQVHYRMDKRALYKSRIAEVTMRQEPRFHSAWTSKSNSIQNEKPPQELELRTSWGSSFLSPQIEKRTLDTPRKSAAL